MYDRDSDFGQSFDVGSIFHRNAETFADLVRFLQSFDRNRKIFISVVHYQDPFENHDSGKVVVVDDFGEDRSHSSVDLHGGGLFCGSWLRSEIMN